MSITQTIEELLLADPHVKEILYETRSLPDLVTESLPQKERRTLDVWRLIAGTYFSYKCIHDDFEFNHAARRQWREGYDAIAGAKTYLDENALRRNALARVQQVTRTLVENYSRSEKEQLAALAQDILTFAFTAYDLKPVSDKLKEVHKIKDRIYDITAFLASHYKN